MKLAIGPIRWSRCWKAIFSEKRRCLSNLWCATCHKPACHCAETSPVDRTPAFAQRAPGDSESRRHPQLPSFDGTRDVVRSFFHWRVFPCPHQLARFMLSAPTLAGCLGLTCPNLWSMRLARSCVPSLSALPQEERG